MSDAPETPPRVDPAALARLLRQRAELANVPLYLDDATRAALLAEVEARGAEAAGAPTARPRRPSAGPGAGERLAARGAERRAAQVARDVTAGTEPAPGSDAVERDSNALPVVSGAPVHTLDYGALRDAAMACTRCGLHETRTNVVFSDGNPEARLVVVGEAPGANEDASGLPFVGAAGKLLDLMLASVDLSREDSVYICNVLKCRPPGNRNPQAGEIEQCAPFLTRQLALVKPEALLAVGTFAAQLLTGRDRPLGRLRGEVHAYEGIPLVVTYHPAALLRNSGWVRPTWDDLQLLRQVMDG